MTFLCFCNCSARVMPPPPTVRISHSGTASPSHPGPCRRFLPCGAYAGNPYSVRDCGRRGEGIRWWRNGIGGSLIDAPMLSDIVAARACETMVCCMRASLIAALRANDYLLKLGRKEQMANPRSSIPVAQTLTAPTFDICIAHLTCPVARSAVRMSDTHSSYRTPFTTSV